MQFRLRNIFISLGLIALVLATLTASYWQFSLAWLAVLAIIAIAVQFWRTYRDRKHASNLVWLIVCILPGAVVGGILGVFAGLIIADHTGWFPGLSTIVLCRWSDCDRAGRALADRGAGDGETLRTLANGWMRKCPRTLCIT